MDFFTKRKREKEIKVRIENGEWRMDSELRADGK